MYLGKMKIVNIHDKDKAILYYLILNILHFLGTLYRQRGKEMHSIAVLTNKILSKNYHIFLKKV